LKQPRVLLVEDDPRLSTLVAQYLEKQELLVDVVMRGDLVMDAIRQQVPDIILLDIMLPVKDGLSLCREIRQQYHMPIIMLTAKDTDIDQILGLENGADDYVIKPVEPPVLLARIRAQLRRVHWGENDDGQASSNHHYQFGRLQIRHTAKQVFLDDQQIDLTSHEFELLALLAQHAGEVLGRDSILQHMRGIQYDGMDRSVDVRVSRLRKKLQDNQQKPFRIKTIWGKGYLFVPDAWD